MTITSDLPLSAQAAKVETERLWAGRTRLDWTTSRLEDGTPTLSARIRGRHEATVLTVFANSATVYFEGRPHTPGDQLPALDVTVPGREVCVWRTGGVWVELWHPTIPAPAAPAAQGPVVPPSTPALRLSGRGLLGGRLPYTRRTIKETSR